MPRKKNGQTSRDRAVLFEFKKRNSEAKQTQKLNKEKKKSVKLTASRKKLKTQDCNEGPPRQFLYLSKNNLAKDIPYDEVKHTIIVRDIETNPLHDSVFVNCTECKAPVCTASSKLVYCEGSVFHCHEKCSAINLSYFQPKIIESIEKSEKIIPQKLQLFAEVQAEEAKKSKLFENPKLSLFSD